MSSLRDWIKQHQILAFYLIVFAVSWPAMVLMFFVFPRNQGLQAIFGLVAVYSPAIVAIMVSAVEQPKPERARTSSRLVAFTISWVASWAVLILHTWQVRGIDPGLQIIIPTGLVALIPGWLLSCALSRVPGVKHLCGTLLRPRGHWLWYVIALATVPAVQLLGAGITVLAGGEVSFDIGRSSLSGATVFLILVFLQGFLASGGINEETGWRGFVLPRLQARLPVITAVAVVWFFWALWHIPYDIGSGTPWESILLNRTLFNLIWALLFAWVYNRTGGSLLAPALFHPAMNTFGDALPRTDAATVIFLLLAITVIVYERMWKRLPADHPAVHQ
jgi:membrane protease YdiL (CAAX protease family)